jgi:hypothetical protein
LILVSKWKALPSKILALINDLRSFNQWNPFAKQDPTVVVACNESTCGKGAGFVFNRDGMVGGESAKGLAGLKTLAEQS